MNSKMSLPAALLAAALIVWVMDVASLCSGPAPEPSLEAPETTQERTQPYDASEPVLQYDNAAGSVQYETLPETGGVRVF